MVGSDFVVSGKTRKITIAMLWQWDDRIIPFARVFTRHVLYLAGARFRESSKKYNGRPLTVPELSFIFDNKGFENVTFGRVLEERFERGTKTSKYTESYKKFLKTCKLKIQDQRHRFNKKRGLFYKVDLPATMLKSTQITQFLAKHRKRKREELLPQLVRFEASDDEADDAKLPAEPSAVDLDDGEESTDSDDGEESTGRVVALELSTSRRVRCPIPPPGILIAKERAVERIDGVHVQVFDDDGKISPKRVATAGKSRPQLLYCSF